MSRPESVFDLVQSHRITVVIYVAAKLNLAEAFGTDAKSAAELAGLMSADESALRRLLVALTTIGVCNRVDRDKFAMTDLGRQLDQNADPSFPARSPIVGGPCNTAATQRVSRRLGKSKLAVKLIRPCRGTP